MAIYSPEEVAKAFREVRTTEDAIAVFKSGGVATIGALGRNMGRTKMEALLKLHLIELNEVLALKVPMGEHQINECAIEILDRYPYMTMADINLVMRRIKCGECGRLYDRLGMPQLMQIFADYADERADVSAQQSMAEADSYKERDRVRSSERQKAAWHEAWKKRAIEKLRKEAK